MIVVLKIARQGALATLAQKVEFMEFHAKSKFGGALPAPNGGPKA